MRFVCELAIAVGLILPCAAMALRQQEPASTANSAGQAPAEPARKDNAPAEQTPTETAPASAKKTPASAAQEKTDAGSASAASRSATSASVKTKHPKRSTPVAAPLPAPAPDGVPRKIVVREGGASEPAAQIAPGMTPAEAIRQRRNAEQLLRSTDDQLKQLADRTLGAQQRETVGQIRNYMKGARSALQEGDLRRGNTLAQKAHLLSDDLVKH